MNTKIIEKIHYQIQYFDNKYMAWKFDKNNYKTLKDARNNVNNSNQYRFTKVTMPKNIIEIIK